MQHHFAQSFMKKAILVMASFVLLACEKDFGEVGLDDVIGNKPPIGTLKSYPITTFHYQQDTVPTLNRTPNLLGTMQDPVFGGIQADLAFELYLQKVNPDFGADPQLDSVFLFVDLDDYYGDTSVTQTWDIYELDESFPSNVNGNTTITTGQLIGSAQVNPTPNRRGKLNSDTLVRGLTIIPLDPAFFDQKIVQEAVNDPSKFQTNEDFVNYFKGLMIKATAGNSILTVDLRGGDSFLRMYYRESSIDSIAREYNLVVSGISSSDPSNAASLFTLDHSTGEFDPSMTDSVNGEATNYIQPMGGPGCAIRIPTLSDLGDTLAINRAEIKFSVRSGSVGTPNFRYEVPSRLLVYMIEEDGTLTRIPDYGSISNPVLDAVGGRPIGGDFREIEYTFNITRYLHKALYEPGTPKTLLIFPDRITTAANRVVLNGSQSPVDPAHLDIYYTRIKK